MIIEVTTLHVDHRFRDGFTTALPEALATIASAEGHVAHKMEKSDEDACQYKLTVHWQDQESAIDRFRESGRMKAVRYLLHRYYDQRPRTCYYSETSVPTRIESQLAPAMA